MRYWLRTFIGLGLCGGAVVAFDNGLYELIHTGTCASGGPYVSARECPPGTGWHVLSLMGGIFGGLIGIAVYTARGEGGRPARVPLGAIMWALLFCSIAAVALLGAFGPANTGEDGVRIMAIVFGFVFIPMGLAPVAMAWGAKAAGEHLKVKLAQAKLSPAARPSQDPPARPAARPEESVIDQLMKLSQLRDSGALTDEEFERQKKKLLGGG